MRNGPLPGDPRRAAGTGLGLDAGPPSRGGIEWSVSRRFPLSARYSQGPPGPVRHGDGAPYNEDVGGSSPSPATTFHAQRTPGRTCAVLPRHLVDAMRPVCRPNAES